MVSILQKNRGQLGDVPSQPCFRQRQSSECDSTINWTYFCTSASSISDATRTGTSLPSTSFLFSFTTSSLLHSMQRTSSFPWHTQPLFAHSISFTGSGFGVQSVSS